ncbi:hypothetical protein MHYP_G00294270 [Metynnis hypsauchen]
MRKAIIFIDCSTTCLTRDTHLNNKKDEMLPDPDVHTDPPECVIWTQLAVSAQHGTVLSVIKCESITFTAALLVISSVLVFSELGCLARAVSVRSLRMRRPRSLGSAVRALGEFPREARNSRTRSRVPAWALRALTASLLPASGHRTAGDHAEDSAGTHAVAPVSRSITTSQGSRSRWLHVSMDTTRDTVEFGRSGPAQLSVTQATPSSS